MIAEQKQMVNIPALPRPMTRPMPERGRDAVAPARDLSRQQRPMAHRGPLALRKARAIHENDRTPGAVLAAAFAVALLCLYVTAYAGVTTEGFELSRLRADVKKAAIQNEMLQAEVSRLTLPETVRQRADALGMVENTPQTAVVTTGSVDVQTASAAPHSQTAPP